ncbi:RNA-dependent ATPase rok1, partial [Claviceps citrina]
GGVAVTFYTKEDIPFVKTVANVIAVSERQAGRTADQRGVQDWLLDALPDVAKEDRKKLRERGVESRRSGSGSSARITSRSGYERTREHNRRGAMDASRRRKAAGGGGDVEEGEWAGLD